MKRKVNEILPEYSMLELIERSKSIHNIEWIKPWKEITGKLNDFSSDEYGVSLKVGDQVIIFDRDSREAACITEFLDEDFRGKYIAILKTDIPEKPVIIRLVYCY